MNKEIIELLERLDFKLFEKEIKHHKSNYYPDITSKCLRKMISEIKDDVLKKKPVPLIHKVEEIKQVSQIMAVYDKSHFVEVAYEFYDSDEKGNSIKRFRYKPIENVTEGYYYDLIKSGKLYFLEK